ncbi:dihydrolipoyl dehydrogenase [Alteribacillus bidgolensis]|uniref:Dihydrolipoyl dehydrogenase n=1 Tax=Alteribacillus bidgolensis TaxID=930129 RepID=A0A1G8IG76_9BACI|nr:dihydrolipoyl dehydrogenase [Alteribacillus bidgolensis]SDI17873.1 dihydrolipoamide dehydrogenase [Alteribacillus bidgolensis]
MGTEDSVETLVIGAGPGGYVAAIRAAQLGQKVMITDKSKLGGVCLNAGCIPSKALIEAGQKYKIPETSHTMGIRFKKPELNVKELRGWKNSIVKRLTDGVSGLLKANNVMITPGKVSFVNENTVLIKNEQGQSKVKFNSCIIATGSRPVEIPTIPNGKRIITSDKALDFNELPSKMNIVGGGYIGIELGTVFSNFGVEVTIIEAGERILPGFSEDMAALVSKKLIDRPNVTIMTNTAVESAIENDEDVQVTVSANDTTHVLDGEYLLVTVGRKPNSDTLELQNAGIERDKKGFIPVNQQCQTNQKHIFAIGDLTEGPALAHKASLQGKIAVEAINGEMNDFTDYHIPAIVFSEPQLAVVGLTGPQAEEKGYNIETVSFPFTANGRAMTTKEEEGFTRLIIDKEDGTLLGAETAGPNASELINKLTVSIQAGLTAEDLSLTVHAHPTLGETIMEAGDKALGTPVHII